MPRTDKPLRVNSFDVLKRMGEENKDIRLSPLDNITHMRLTKLGTKITIGVAGDVLNGLANGKFVGGLILADKAQFDEVKKKMRRVSDYSLASEVPTEATRWRVPLRVRQVPEYAPQSSTARQAGEREGEEMKPTAEQSSFITDTLIPALLADDGVFFAMATWRDDFATDDLLTGVMVDGVARTIPHCGSICCIGGWIEVIMYPDQIAGAATDRMLGAHLGLSEGETHGLFYGFASDFLYFGDSYGWPCSYRRRYAEARTTRAKAEVAAELLREIAANGGELLHVVEKD